MSNPIIALFLLILCYLAIFLASGAWKRTSIGKKLITRKKKSPIRDMMFRAAGESLRDKALDATLDLASFVGIIPSIVLIGFILIISEKNPKSPAAIFTVAVYLGTVVVCLFKLRKAYKNLHSLRLGLDGEIATAQELNQLMLQGYHVYHDFQADNFNIDHVVIGASGVFAVETKAKLKPKAKGLQSAKVSYDGNALKFPDGQEPKFLSQAENQARWLADFLSKSVGKPIPVTPVLALPGWMVDRLVSDNSVLVINPKEAVKMIPNRTNILDEQTIQQVRYQVEQKCRTVEPYEPVL